MKCNYDDDYEGKEITEAEQKCDDALCAASEEFYTNTWSARQKVIVAGNPELYEMTRQYDEAFTAVSILEEDRLDVIASLPLYADLLPALRAAWNEHRKLVTIDGDANSYNVVMGAYDMAYKIKLSMQKIASGRHDNITKPLRDEYNAAVAPYEAVYKAKVAAINVKYKELI